ncbi:hypothetical protein HCN44_010855 [Aphidius gifuensis]|uniref:Uncharacterized protein n=1 Tax=Aphidius gifuensis TaxID=684658 RepID=A0A834XJN3_APHGI|nr:hypothetical protein HCN44_010855 [Aphidius gifuensis]
MTDSVMAVRCASKCLLEIFNHAPFLYTNEIESALVAITQLSICQTLFNKNNHKNISSSLSDGGGGDDTCGGNNNNKTTLLDDVLNILISGFLLGGTGSGFLEGTGEKVLSFGKAKDSNQEAL